MDRLAGTYASRGREPGGNGAARPRRVDALTRRVDTKPTADAPFAPQFIIQLIEEVVPDDTIITCDAGENRLFMMQWYRAGRRRRLPAARRAAAAWATQSRRPSEPDSPTQIVRSSPSAATAGSVCRFMR